MVTARSPRVTIVGPDLSRVLALGVSMRQLFVPTMVESSQPMRESLGAVRSGADCVIVPLTGRESVVEVRELLSAAGDTAILFLAERLPLRSALARVIDGAGHTILAAAEGSSTIEATLIALLAKRDARG